MVIFDRFNPYLFKTIFILLFYSSPFIMIFCTYLRIHLNLLNALSTKIGKIIR